MCSWGQLREKKTGFTFYLFNTHLDHVGVEARKESTKLILAKVKEMAGSTPVILMGDFNVMPTDIDVQHDGHVTTRYSHLSRLLVVPGA